MIIVRAFFGMCFIAVMLWGFAEAYTRKTYGEFSPKHSAVLSLIPGSSPQLDVIREVKRKTDRQ